ncbi:2-octaprenyl-6-methoxyphenyl hydroxylase [Vibrio sp. S4B1]|nr:2-octaprenyl-6-methoxyphenyl hydroxylase [Vibrio methylphosphonaticus]
MAGATLAMALNQGSNQSLKIAVIEPYQPDHQSHPGFDARSIALSYGTVAILKHFQLWSLIEDHATPITHIHISDRGHAGMTDFYADKEGLEAMGYVVELAEVGRRFSQHLSQQHQIELFCPYSVNHIERGIDSAVVTLSSNDGEASVQLETKLVVAADGAESLSCQSVGLTQQSVDFNQTAIIANVVTAEPHRGRAFERFTANGPLALLPMSQGRSSLVWCMPPLEAQRVLSLPQAEFLSELQQAFGWRLGQFSKVGSIASYPLLLRHRERISSHRFAAVGNAAQTLHPIAGQGFNLGIRDIATLVDSLLLNKKDVGDYANLIRFQTQREQDRSTTIAMTSALVQIFSNDLFAFRVGRNMGLGVLDTFPLLKSPLFNRALGVVNR